MKKPYALFQTQNKTIHIGGSSGYNYRKIKLKYVCGVLWRSGSKRVSPGSKMALLATLNGEEMCKKCRAKLSKLAAAADRPFTSFVLAN